MSHIRSLAPTLRRVKRLGGGVTAGWPVACIPFALSGCYFGPIEIVLTNLAPKLVDSNHTVDEPIVLERPDQQIYVVFEDEEPELLTFTWTLSIDGVIADAETFPVSGESKRASQVRLDATDLELHGQVLKCLVSDDSYTPVLQWPVEVVQ